MGLFNYLVSAIGTAGGTVTVTIGAGGAAGTATSATGGAGGAGGVGGITSFGTLNFGRNTGAKTQPMMMNTFMATDDVVASTSQGVGTTADLVRTTGGGFEPRWIWGGMAGLGDTPSAGVNSGFTGAGGGAGGGVSAVNAAVAGQPGGKRFEDYSSHQATSYAGLVTVGNGGDAGTVSGGAGGTAASSGGGGGAGHASGTGGAGAAGAVGCGGGGGGGCRTGNTSGAGGAGGSGRIRVWVIG